jgi:hypothetical protein
MDSVLNKLRDIGIQGEGSAHLYIIVPPNCGIKMPPPPARIPQSLPDRISAGRKAVQPKLILKPGLRVIWVTPGRIEAVG